MSSLSDTSTVQPQHDQPASDMQQTTSAQPVSPVSAGNKEVENIHGLQNEGLRDATGAEAELPKEVVSAGVRIQPTTIPIPPPVAKMGVQPSGQNVPTQTTPTVALPLSDDQIAAGLSAGITDSIHWLATWCVRRLKLLHITLKNVHGKFIRVSETE